MIHKHARGLVDNNRNNELFKEIGNDHWDIITVNETWRTETCEYWAAKKGHAFAGARFEEHKRRVAITVHSRWARSISNFKPVDEGFAYIDIDIDIQQIGHDDKLRIATVYFSHGGYADVHAQRLYTMLSSGHKERKAEAHSIGGLQCRGRKQTRTRRPTDHRRIRAQRYEQPSRIRISRSKFTIALPVWNPASTQGILTTFWSREVCGSL